VATKNNPCVDEYGELYKSNGRYNEYDNTEDDLVSPVIQAWPDMESKYTNIEI